MHWPLGGKGDTSLPHWLYPIIGIAVLVCGGGVWAVWRVVLPRVGKFKWVQTKERLGDGTVVTRFRREKKE